MTTLVLSFFNRLYSFFQVTRTTIKAWMSLILKVDPTLDCVAFPIKRNSRGEHPAALKLPLLP